VGHQGKHPAPPSRPKREVDREIGALEKTVLSFEEAFEKLMEVRCGKRERSLQKVLDALLNLVSENRWNH